MSQGSDKLRPLMKNGSLTMLALDQRGSLRTIIANGREEGTISDGQLTAFKAAAADILAPMASDVLLDSGLGRDATKKVPKGIPLILSADDFEQAAGGPVTKSGLDPKVTPELIRELGATAIKLLIIWYKGSGPAFRRDTVARFVDLACRTGAVSLVEGFVRDANGDKFRTTRDHGEAVIEAARELADARPDVYMADVPGYLPGQLCDVARYARELTKAIKQPWVVLSNGVEAKDFPETVRLCCENGASGFLAGRAIWADAAAKADPIPDLKRESVPRLRRLIDIVQSAHQAGAA